MNDLLVGLDLGTSAVKVGLFDATGRLLRLARREYPLYTPRPGWAEQEPQEWWEATCTALREALAEVDAGQVAAVGLSGQTPGHVLVTADGTPLGRVIIWSDRRATAEAAWLARQVTPQQARDWTGYPFIAEATLPPARLLWLKAHRPDDWARCAAIVQPKDFIALRLTGRIATDRHSSFCLFNSQTGRYHPEYLELLGMEPDKMPPVLAPTEVVGHVRPEAATATGLAVGVPVVTGTIDAWCDIIGCGGIVPGRAVDVAGTSEVVALVTDGPAEGKGVFSSPLLEGLYWVGGPMQTGGGALLWLLRGFYREEAGFAQLEDEASAVPPGAGGLLFLPYLRGERAPVWDETASGAFVGLTDRHTRAHCARAVYEGVAFAVQHVLSLAEGAAGLTATELRVCGGGSRSRFWNQLKADVTGKRVLELQVAETAVLGAAMWAAVSIGLYPDMGTAAGRMVRVKAELSPDFSLRSRYDELAALYQDLYSALQGTFAGLEAWRGRYEGGDHAHP